MQKFIAMYGLAAHLAILAVAPLFLSPLVVIWLAVIAVVWTLNEPSRRSGEMLHDARVRLNQAVARDPLMWVLGLIVIGCLIRFWNNGITLRYDAEATIWSLAEPMWPLLPGAAEDAGWTELAEAIATVALVLGCRHGLGKSARTCFLLVSSFLAGIFAGYVGVRASMGIPSALAYVNFSSAQASYHGVAFGLFLLAGTGSLLGVLELRWYRAFPMIFASIGGTAYGLFMFSPIWLCGVFAVAFALLSLYAIIYAHRMMPAAMEFKFVMITLIGLAIAGAGVMGTATPARLQARIAPVLNGELFNTQFMALRQVLSDLALKVWRAHPWLGSGLGTFPLDIRFNAVEADWAVIDPLQRTTFNGYWQILAEQGLIGAAWFVVPICFLLWTYLRRLVKGVMCAMPGPICWIGLLGLIVVGAETLVDVSVLSFGVYPLLAALFAVSTNSFPVEKMNG